MPGSQTGPSAQNSLGLLAQPSVQLRPGVLLRRLRPVQLAAVVRQGQQYRRTVQGLKLLRQYFPAELAGYRDLASVGWWEILAVLANLVGESGWFEVDWDSLNLAWASWMEAADDEGDYLALFLEYLPVRLYGFSPEELAEFPAMELFRVLLDERVVEASPNLLIASELYDGLSDWGETDRAAAWERLRAIEADPGRYPEPVRWLPELARYACRRTGNFILDQTFDLERGPWLSWREPEQVRTAWRRARPVIEQFRRLTQWVEADQSRLTLLAYALMEGNHYDELEW
jgi:hypothetical protein